MLGFHRARGGRRTFKELIKILNRKRKMFEIEEDTLEKIKQKDKLTSEEFWKVHAILQKEGPKVKYTNPDGWYTPSKK